MYILWLTADGMDGVEDYSFGIDIRNILRYANHSSEPNGRTDVEVKGARCALVAAKRIRQHEEITFHYGDSWDYV